MVVIRDGSFVTKGELDELVFDLIFGRKNVGKLIQVGLMFRTTIDVFDGVHGVKVFYPL